MTVQSTSAEVLPIEFGVDTVYVRTNIQQKHDNENNTNYFEYDEVQYSLKDYLQILLKQQDERDQAIAELSQLIGGLIKNGI